MEFIVMYFLFYGYVCPSCFEMFDEMKVQRICFLIKWEEMKIYS